MSNIILTCNRGFKMGSSEKKEAYQETKYCRKHKRYYYSITDAITT
jgi:hypothetical protein